MKLKLSLFTFLILLFFFLNSTKGEIRLGPTIAANFSFMNWKIKGVNVPKQVLLGGQIGLTSEFNLYKQLYLRHGLLITQKGASYPFGTEELVISPLYLEVPIVLLKKFPFDNAKINILFLAGGFIDYAIGGTYKYSYSENSHNIKYGTGQQNNMKEFDLGLNCGLGIEFWKVSLIGKYDHGLTNLSSDETDNGVMKSRLFSFSFCILFGEKEKKSRKLI